MENQTLTPWLYRRWAFDFPAELYPVVLERLAGLPTRCREISARITQDQAIWAPSDGWSIQRHFAHFVDLESLLHTRLDAYERGDPVLPPADMSNARTTQGDHDSCSIDEVLDQLDAQRERTLARLRAYPRDFFGRSAWHERLGIQKRVVDSCVFFADHDDHHLALVRMILDRIHDRA